MSYNLYLTHKKHWALDEPAEKIPYDEFKAFVASYDGITIENEKADEGSIQLVYKLPAESGADTFDFAYVNGDVRTTSNYTDKYAFKMLLDIAEKFGVSIQGEEAEVYTRDDVDTFSTYAEIEAKQQLSQTTKETQATDTLKSINVALKVYYILLVVCVVSIIGIFILPFPLYRIRQLRKKREQLTSK